MSVASFIPEIWNASLLLEFRQQALAASVSNREYEGNAAVGNTVVINSAIDVDIKDYATGVGGNPRTTEPDAVAADDQKLLIDQEKNFDFLVDDIDRRQAAGSMDAYTQSAGLGLAEDSDKFLLALAEAGAHADNQLDGGGDAPANGNEAFDILADLRKALNKKSVPNARRVAFINAEFARHLYGADAKHADASVIGDTSGIRNAALGQILGFNLIESENLPETDDPQVVAWYVPAVAYVSQIQDTEGMRAQASFADRLRGLHVYGGRVIRPVGVATWNVGTA